MNFGNPPLPMNYRVPGAAPQVNPIPLSAFNALSLSSVPHHNKNRRKPVCQDYGSSVTMRARAPAVPAAYSPDPEPPTTSRMFTQIAAPNRAMSGASLFSSSLSSAAETNDSNPTVDNSLSSRASSVRGMNPVSAAAAPVGPDVRCLLDNREEMFARKVFVGGLPIDVTEEEIGQCFSQFGNVIVDWPRRPDGNGRDDGSRPSRAMTGYVFLVFERESSVQDLVRACSRDEDRYFLLISSPTMPLKPVQVRPWRLSDMDFMPDATMPLDPRRTVFIGGVPRPTRACELAECMSTYGPVCYVGIDIDPELKYPKGAARVTFTTTEAFVAAITGRFVHVRHGDSEKRVEIKPYVMDEQMCDECLGAQCLSRYAPYFCGDPTCLQYYCEHCWDKMHCQADSGLRVRHRVIVRQGDQTKVLEQPPHHTQYQARGRMRHNNSHYGHYQH